MADENKTADIDLRRRRAAAAEKDTPQAIDADEEKKFRAARDKPSGNDSPYREAVRQRVKKEACEKLIANLFAIAVVTVLMLLAQSLGFL